MQLGDGAHDVVIIFDDNDDNNHNTTYTSERNSDEMNVDGDLDKQSEHRSVTDESEVHTVSAGWDFTCAVNLNKHIRCWGLNM